MEESLFRAMAICTLDGRYAQVGSQLSEFFSEFALIKKRVFVEIRWFIYLMQNKNIMTPNIDSAERKSIIGAAEDIYKKFDTSDYERVKKIEDTTKHDVKAVEYFICEKLEKMGLSKAKSFVHFGCTSEDINNTAYALLIKECLNEVWLKNARSVIMQLQELANTHADTPMLAHTHGQPATPTTVGKEFKIFVYRLDESLINILDIKIKAKFNGATGNYSSFKAAYPQLNWEEIARDFVENHIGVAFNPLTTQIESHDYICHILDGVRHFNNVLLDFNVDMWLYISMDYFKQKAVKSEVGSSVMPHKVNPINFENSEANLEMSNSICMSLSNKLPKSRMQRDLSDSSSLRNLGLAFGYSLQALTQTANGIKKCVVNMEKLKSDLEDKWQILAEPIQTILRKYGISDAYERLKEMTRGRKISREEMLAFVETLDGLSAEDKKTLRSLNPSNYIGLAAHLAKRK